MNSGKYDVAVAYRIYPRVSKIPAMFADDKLSLARLCLRSFRESLGALRVKMFVLLDGCPPEFEALFLEFFDREDLEFVHLNGIGNQRTFSRQIDVLLQQDDADAIYFAEDDYFYLPGQFEVMLQFLRAYPDADFISAYDHPDYYTLPLHGGEKLTREFAGRSWRTAASTCLTFLTTKQVLANTRKVFETYRYRNPDVCLWMSLTKHAVFEPGVIWRSFRRRFAMGGFIAVSWLFGWPQILLGKRWKLWIPCPSIATHTEERFLAPGVDWRSHFEIAGKLV